MTFTIKRQNKLRRELLKRLGFGVSVRRLKSGKVRFEYPKIVIEI